MNLIEDMTNYILEKLKKNWANHEQILSLENFFSKLEVQNENFKNCFEKIGN